MKFASEDQKSNQRKEAHAIHRRLLSNVAPMKCGLCNEVTGYSTNMCSPKQLQLQCKEFILTQFVSFIQY